MMALLEGIAWMTWEFIRLSAGVFFVVGCLMLTMLVMSFASGFALVTGLVLVGILFVGGVVGIIAWAISGEDGI